MSESGRHKKNTVGIPNLHYNAQMLTSQRTIYVAIAS